MIVKIATWKVPNFKRLINYIHRDKGRSTTKEKPLYYNILDPSLRGAISEFRDNDNYRKKRQGGVAVYHEILSFHKEDSPLLTDEILRDIAMKYITIRCPNALCFSKFHVHDGHFHIHFAISGNEIASDRVLRLDNKAFKELRRQIEAYQIEKYPFLSHSVVYHSQKEIRRISDKEYQFKKRTAEKSDKDIVIELLNRAFRRCQDFESFCLHVSGTGLEVYYYRDKINGVIYNGRKYKFKTLGFQESLFYEKERKIRELDTIRNLIVLQKAHKTVIQSANHVISDLRHDFRDNITNRDILTINRKVELRSIQLRRQYTPRMIIR